MRKISIIVPCRNEASYIGRFLASAAAQQLDGFDWEVIIADGMSGDGTREIIERFCRLNPRFRVIDNPSRVAPPGLNAAILQARGEIVVRMDVHAEYRCDYVRECVAVLDETGAANAGGAHRPFAGGFRERVFAAAFQSPFAVGGALSHNCRYEGPVDTVIFGCWRKKTLEEIGCFDAGLVRNQDDELNFRIVRSGQTVWQSQRIISWYHPRTSVRQLFQQYFQYGYWKVPVILKHGAPASWRHLVPGAFVAALAALVAATALGAAAGLGEFAAASSVMLGAVLALYLLACAAAAAHSALSHGWAVVPFLPVLFAMYHFGYGCGFLLGVNAHLRGSPAAEATRPVFTALTR